MAPTLHRERVAALSLMEPAGAPRETRSLELATARAARGAASWCVPAAALVAGAAAYGCVAVWQAPDVLSVAGNAIGRRAPAPGRPSNVDPEFAGTDLASSTTTKKASTAQGMPTAHADDDCVRDVFDEDQQGLFDECLHGFAPTDEYLASLPEQKLSAPGFTQERCHQFCKFQDVDMAKKEEGEFGLDKTLEAHSHDMFWLDPHGHCRCLPGMIDSRKYLKFVPGSYMGHVFGKGRKCHCPKLEVARKSLWRTVHAPELKHGEEPSTLMAVYENTVNVQGCAYTCSKCGFEEWEWSPYWEKPQAAGGAAVRSGPQYAPEKCTCWSFKERAQLNMELAEAQRSPETGGMMGGTVLSNATELVYDDVPWSWKPVLMRWSSQWAENGLLDAEDSCTRLVTGSAATADALSSIWWDIADEQSMWPVYRSKKDEDGLYMAVYTQLRGATECARTCAVCQFNQWEYSDYWHVEAPSKKCTCWAKLDNKDYVSRVEKYEREVGWRGQPLLGDTNIVDLPEGWKIPSMWRTPTLIAISEKIAYGAHTTGAPGYCFKAH